MKTWEKWGLIGLGIFSALLLLLIGIFIVVILKFSLWWLWSALIVLSIAWLIVGGYFLWQSISQKIPDVEQVDLGEAENIARYDNVYDKDNPDNFMMIDKKLFKIGTEGSEKTPIQIFRGQGSELLEARWFLINLKNIKEKSLLIEPTREEVIEATIKLADAQPTTEIIESVSEGLDQWGRPQMKVKVTRQTPAQLKEEKAKEEEEKKLAL